MTETSTTAPALQPLTKKVPQPIASRLIAWRRLWVAYAALDYLLGGAAVLCASLSAAGVKHHQVLAAMSAGLTALLGFMQPGKRYFRVVQAWRLLDAACLRFELGQGTIDDMLDAMASGERLLTKLEQLEAGGEPSKATE